MYRKIKFLVVLILFSTLTISAFGFQSIELASPESVGLSSERLQRIAPLMQSYIDEGKLSGALTMVARKGKVVHLNTYGYQNKEKQIPVDEHSIFRIYSMTKPITSVAVMMLYERGHFLIDDPIEKYIPEFKDLRVYKSGTTDNMETEPLNQSVTIRDLLTHTSGFTYGIFSQTPVDTLYRKAQVLRGGDSLSQAITRLSNIPLLNQPGEVWHYSVSTDVLGYLVEKVSGITLADFVEKNILDPLNMNDTGFEVAESDLGRFTVNYQLSEKGSLKPVDGGKESQFAAPVTFYSGGGGMVSTADDYMRFAQMLLNGGEYEGTRLLSPKTVEFMTENHLGREFEPGWGFGLGFRINVNLANSKILGSEGTYDWSGAANTYFFIDPKEELIAMVWTQLFPYGAYPFAQKFKVAVYQSLVESLDK